MAVGRPASERRPPRPLRVDCFLELMIDSRDWSKRDSDILVVVVNRDVAVSVEDALNECSEYEEAEVALFGWARGSWVENSCRGCACKLKRSGGDLQSDGLQKMALVKWVK